MIQQRALLRFLDALEDAVEPHFSIPVEFETNCTLMPTSDWSGRPNTTWVCSPKLANNGDPESRRYKPEVLKWHAGSHSSTFKFVVTGLRDVDEIFEKYINPFGIAHDRIWIMPECATTAQFKSKARWVAELCKKFRFNFSPRLQILIWEQALGV